jgi:hypothetical protein
VKRPLTEMAVVAAVSLFMLTVTLSFAGLALSVAWSRSVVAAFGLPEISASQSIWLLVSLWLVGIPLRGFSTKSGHSK